MGKAAPPKKEAVASMVPVDDWETDSDESSSDESSQEAAPQQKKVRSEARSSESTSDSEPPPHPALPRKSDPEPPKKAKVKDIDVGGKEKTPRGKDKEEKEKKDKESKEKEKDKEVASKGGRKGKKQKNTPEKYTQEERDEKKPAVAPAAPTEAAAAAAPEKPASQQPKMSTAKKSLWGGKDESILAQRMLEELKTGSDFHTKPKADVYWEELCQSLKGKLSHDYTKEQIFDKHRRMKAKFDKYESSKPGSRKRSHAEDALHAVFKQLWGRDLPADINGEESNGDVEMTPSRNEARAIDDTKASIRATEGQVLLAKLSSDPVLTIATSLLHSVMTNQKMGSEYMRGGNRENRKRHLEEQIIEYSSMKRRLKLAMDYCELEAELLEKKLNSV